jgi:gliding motility-associated-like protein
MAANGCDSILAFYLTVIPPSYTVQTRTICQGDSLLFGSLFLKTEGIYYDTLVSLYANGCDSIVTLHLRVGGRFTVTPHITDDPCSDVKSAVSLTFSDGIAPYSCLWNTGKTTATIDSLDAGTYTAVIADSIGCKAEYAVTFVKNSLSVSYTATAAHCGQADGSITLLITSDSTDYSINWGHIAMPAAHGGKTAYNLLPGVYPITVSDSLCVKNMQISIENLPPPVACFTATYKKDDFDEPLAVSNCSENGTGYVWDFGDGSSSTEIEPLYWYTDFGTYTILLTVYDDFGCLDTAALEIQLTERSVCYIPNTFTPNGDGLNDIFIPICRNIRTHDYVFTIYDRWGNRIFASHNPDQGWDGTINGDPVASGNVYSWTLTYQDEFNNLQAQQGSITILR